MPISEPEQRSRLPSLTPFAFFSAALAIWIDFGSLHDLDNADALIPILVSLYKWTPFYWEQDRWGMLVPLLAIPVKQPFWNLMLQWFLSAYAAVLSFVLAARYLFPVRTWPLIAMSALALYFALVPLKFQFHYLATEPYGLAMALGLGALLAAPRALPRLSWRLLISYGLMTLAHWVNIGLVLVLVPVLIAFAVSDRLSSELDRLEKTLDQGRKDSGRIAEHGIALGITVAGAINGLILRTFGAGLPTSLGLTDLPWGPGWRALFANFWQGLSPPIWPWALAIIGVAGLGPVFSHSRRRRFAGLYLRSVLLIAAGILYFLILGTLRWVSDNLYSARYFNPALLIIQTAIVALIVPLANSVTEAKLRRMEVVAGLAVLLAAYVGFGLPSMSRVRSRVAVVDPVTRDVIAERCTHVAGDYWDVWPIVYRATLNLYESGHPRPVYGVTERAGPVLQTVLPSSEMRIALLASPDDEGERWLQIYKLGQVKPSRRLPTITVLEASR